MFLYEVLDELPAGARVLDAGSGPARGTTRAATTCGSPRSTSSSRPARRRLARGSTWYAPISRARRSATRASTSDRVPLRARARHGARGLLRRAGARHAHRRDAIPVGAARGGVRRSALPLRRLLRQVRAAQARQTARAPAALRLSTDCSTCFTGAGSSWSRTRACRRGSRG